MHISTTQIMHFHHTWSNVIPTAYCGLSPVNSVTAYWAHVTCEACIRKYESTLRLTPKIWHHAGGAVMGDKALCGVTFDHILELNAGWSWAIVNCLNCLAQDLHNRHASATKMAAT